MQGADGAGHRDKVWSLPNAWEEGERPAIAVALDVDVEKVMALFRERFGIER